MIIAPLVNLASGLLDSLISTNAPAKTTAASSPFAQMLNSLEQLEQSSLSSYQQVTKQVANFTNAVGSLNL
jgi:ferritin